MTQEELDVAMEAFYKTIGDNPHVWDEAAVSEAIMAVDKFRTSQALDKLADLSYEAGMYEEYE